MRRVQKIGTELLVRSAACERLCETVRRQFSLGRSIDSTMMADCPIFSGTSFKPNCSFTAVKIEGASGVAAGDGAAVEDPGRGSGSQVRSKSYLSLRPVPSLMTVRTLVERKVVSLDICAPLPTRFPGLSLRTKHGVVR